MTPINSTTEDVYLIFGARGWVAGHLESLLKSQGCQTHKTTARIEDRQAVMQALTDANPTRVFNCAGCTGRPNVDWCEDNKEATIRSNVIGTLNLADCCFLLGIHLTVFATGCIYQYDTTHTKGGIGFVETDPANFDGSFYSATKSKVEEIMMHYPSVLILRLRMPVSDDLHPRNFVTKISKYDRVVDIPNSNSILYDLLPAAIVLAQNHETGVYNFTNPGAISHNEVLSLFRDIVRPDFSWANFSEAEQAETLKAGRSNCTLDTNKLEKKLNEYGIHIPVIQEAYKQCFRRMVQNGVS